MKHHLNLIEAIEFHGWLPLKKWHNFSKICVADLSPKHLTPNSWLIELRNWHKESLLINGMTDFWLERKFVV